MFILSQNKSAIMIADNLGINDYKNTESFIVKSLGSEDELILGRYQSKRAKEVMADIWIALKNGDKSHELPEK